MSRSFFTNIKEYTERKAANPDLISKQTQRLIDRLGTIITSVTEQPTTLPKTIISCWNKINRKPCSGKIDASIELSNFDMLWHCLECGDHGTIKHWEHSIWDGKYRIK